eukprot:scaffold82388_cov35-Tisochrysis_lutea.AAC.5
MDRISTRMVSSEALPSATAAANVTCWPESASCVVLMRKNSGCPPRRRRCGTPSCKSMGGARSTDPQELLALSNRSADTREGADCDRSAVSVTRACDPATRCEQKPPPPCVALSPGLEVPVAFARTRPCRAVKQRCASWSPAGTAAEKLAPSKGPPDAAPGGMDTSSGTRS